MVYIQSGGPTSVINTSLYGAIKEAKLHPHEIEHIYGSHYGIEGLIFDDLFDLGKEDDKTIELLKQTPGSILGSTRRKLPKDLHDPIYMKIIENINKHNIGYVFVNGGNDSMDTCNRIAQLCEELKLDVKVIGVPKTIDNDLAITDHSLGFPSAAKHVVNVVGQIATDARCFARGKVHVIEIMGRNAGWLTASVDLLPESSRPDLIYIPEVIFNIDEFMKDVDKIYKEKGSVIVAMSEGVEFPRDVTNARRDAFGHIQLEGGAGELCRLIDEKLDLPTRSVELSIPQRADSAYISKVDSDEAVETGKLAVRSALKGETGKMIIFKRVSSHPYKMEMELADVSRIANEVSMIPPDMIYSSRRMSDSFRDYLRPLIQGEISIEYKDGIAVLAELKKVKA